MAKHPKEELIAVYLIGGGTAGVAWAAFTHLPIGDRIAAVVLLDMASQAEPT
jgi:hypothetical protein